MIRSRRRCKHDRDELAQVVAHQDRVISFLIECLEDERNSKSVQTQSPERGTVPDLSEARWLDDGGYVGSD